MDAIEKTIVGTWSYVEQDDMEPFLNAIEAPDFDKNAMMSSRPRLTFAVEGDKIVFTNTPNPTTDPSSVISYKCGLGEEITIGITQNVKMRFEWKDGKLVQHMHPTTMKKGTIEYSLNDKSQLLKVYKYSPENGGSDVTATIKFEKAK
ncbi:hypothetical protein MAR_003271 [Mya arenaria]|uniref:Lipocalin-like domain-containing protein n=1 Tax=Mya arenaria TaxID=6604 RepID=A0ABY7G5I3_MYAAR|nr:uncharacterized protein LOC128221075 [Mya arenaria]WAR29703.1 hypothetical protein MAR_003271 [Mya arenaria]